MDRYSYTQNVIVAATGGTTFVIAMMLFMYSIGQAEYLVALGSCLLMVAGFFYLFQGIVDEYGFDSISFDLAKLTSFLTVSYLVTGLYIVTTSSLPNYVVLVAAAWLAFNFVLWQRAESQRPRYDL